MLATSHVCWYHGYHGTCHHKEYNALVKMVAELDDCIAHEWQGQHNTLNSCERRRVDTRERPSVFNDDAPDVRIVAVGDLHGDWQCLLRLLELSQMCTFTRDRDQQVVDCHWNGGLHDYLVVCGDCVDMKRGVEPPVAEVAYAEWRILLLLNQLCDESDGHVIRLVGNHELMLLEGVEDFRTAMSIQNDQRRGQGDWRRLWMQTDGMYRRLVASFGGYRAVVRINRWMFCHGGVPYQLVKQLNDELHIDGDRTLEYINQFYYRLVTENRSKRELRTQHGISDELYHNLLQVLWTRVYASPAVEMLSPCAEYTRMIDRLYPGEGAHYKLVVAHCIQPANGLLRGTESPTVSIRTMIPQRLFRVSNRITSSRYDHRTQTCVYPPDPSADDASTAAANCPKYVGINGDCPDSTAVPRVFRIDCAMSHAFDALFDDTPEMRAARQPQILVVTGEAGSEHVEIHRFERSV
jgi:hypothetical protein